MIEVLLGDEFDLALIAKLKQEEVSVGGSITGTGWTLAGSQLVGTCAISFADGCIEASAETYLGLTLRGEESLVMRLARCVVPDGLMPPSTKHNA